MRCPAVYPIERNHVWMAKLTPNDCLFAVAL
jgi:hypothetical protein